MPPFPKLRTSFDYDLDTELSALREHKRLRGVPKRSRNRLLLCTWNIANFGVQKRREKDHSLLAEILSWFDLVAVQEVAEEFNERIGPFDFDNALFKELWDFRRPTPFLAYTRYYVSDHRPLWAEFRV